MRKFLTVVLSLGVFTMPLAASADQISDLQEQIKVLSQILAGLQKKSSTGATTAPGSCPTITAALGPGSTGPNVTVLQQFLAHFPELYPEGKVTGYYGDLTVAAVKRFQAKYNIASSGTPSTTGYGRVGPKTLEVINSMCGASADNVGAFMQVSPVEGDAPLQVNIQVTVNTTNSCGSATYTLDFGDQSQPATLNVPVGTCQTLQQTYTHTYSHAATYELKLSAGTHSSEATVVAQ